MSIWHVLVCLSHCVHEPSLPIRRVLPVCVTLSSRTCLVFVWRFVSLYPHCVLLTTLFVSPCLHAPLTVCLTVSSLCPPHYPVCLPMSSRTTDGLSHCVLLTGCLSHLCVLTVSSTPVGSWSHLFLCLDSSFHVTVTVLYSFVVP